MTRLPFACAAGLLALGISTGVLGADVQAVVGWSQKVELGTLVSGVVSQVEVQPGQLVKKGDNLITLDNRGFNGLVSRRQAEFAHAQAALQEAQREDERAAELYDRTLLSDYERNQALIALHAARAQLERARSELVTARLDLEHSAVRAPFDGVVLAVNAAPGQSVVSEMQSQPLVTLAANRVYRARAQIDLAQAGQLAPGQRLQASARGQAIEGSVAYVGFEPVAQSAQGPQYELVAEFAVTDQQPLRVGETVILHLE